MVFPPGSSAAYCFQAAGAPPVMVPNRAGYAALDRDVPFCPLEDDNPLIYMELLHFDATSFGSTSHEGIYSGGVGVADHLWFTVGEATC